MFILYKEFSFSVVLFLLKMSLNVDNNNDDAADGTEVVDTEIELVAISIGLQIRLSITRSHVQSWVVSTE